MKPSDALALPIDSINGAVSARLMLACGYIVLYFPGMVDSGLPRSNTQDPAGTALRQPVSSSVRFCPVFEWLNVETAN